MPERGKKRGIPYWRKILVTGDTGFLGHHIIPILEDKYYMADIIRPQGSKFFDLTNPRGAEVMFKSIMQDRNEPGPIDTVINLAALSGGIKDNMERPASYYYQNTMICTNIVEECAKNKVSKLIQFMGGCSFPNKTAEEPFVEEEMWNGRPVGTSAGYSMAKKMTIISAEAYEQQFGLKTTVLIPTNLIGPWDNFSEEHSHVAPALIRRFIEARDEGYSNVEVWGSGTPVRDFIYVGDVAKVVPAFIDGDAGVGPYNISTGEGTSIAELAETISRVVGYTGKIHFDKSKPDGQMHKTLDNSKVVDFLASQKKHLELTPLDEAIAITAEWYEKRVLGR